MKNDTRIKVLNRDNGATMYSIPEMNGLQRTYEAGETKEVTFEELEKLSYIPGGMELLRDNLIILDNPEAIKLLLGSVEPEYNYTEEDIKKLMISGSLDEFLDCLDFAPQGVREIIKRLAVTLPLNDVRKREAIYEKTGFNVDNAIRIKQESESPVENKLHKAERRVQKPEEKTNTTTVRRVVSSKKEN